MEHLFFTSSAAAAASPLPLRERVLSRESGEAGEGGISTRGFSLPHPARGSLRSPRSTLSREGRGQEGPHAAH